MPAIYRNGRLRILLFVLIALVRALWVAVQLEADTLGERAGWQHSTVPRRVMTFYYPWYGTPDGPGSADRRRSYY
jgi:hypothetical protein